MEAESTSLPARLLRAIGIFEDALLVILLTAMITVAGTQIVLRNLFDGALLWADPMLRVAVLWVGMIGAMVATRHDKQISVDAVSRFLPDQWKARLRVLTDLFTAIVSSVVAWSAYRLMIEDRIAGGMSIGFAPVWVCEAILPIGFGVIALRYFLYAIKHFREGVAEEELF